MTSTRLSLRRGLVSAALWLLPACATGPGAPTPQPRTPPRPGSAPTVVGTPAPQPAASEPTAELPAGPRLGVPLQPLAALPRPPIDATARKDWLKARLDEVLDNPALAGAKVSAYVTEFESGKTVYARSEKTSLNAASNVKLVTSAAALALLGPEHRFRTTVHGPGRPNERWLGPGGEVVGDLWVRGGGDPTLSTQDLDDLARELQAMGVRKVRGGLVVDATYFDGGAIAPVYDQKQESAAFRAPSSATSLNANTIGITIVPAATAGTPARVVLEPLSPYGLLVGRVLTAESAPAVPAVETSDAGDGRTRVEVNGRVRLGSEPRTHLRRVVHPELYFGHTFQQLLARRGVTFEKPLRLEPVPAQGYRVLATHVSAPLGVIAHELNKRSSNFVAEQIVRALGAEVVGAPGTWDKGLEAIARWLESIGVNRGTYRMQNGAGLYDSNRFSSEQIAFIVRAAMRDFRIASEYLASMSLAATDGTLAQRMGGGFAARFVRGKTGTLQNVSCLSGVAGAPGEKPLVFSLLMNDLQAPGEARAAQDRAAELLVWYLDPRLVPPGP